MPQKTSRAGRVHTNTNNAHAEIKYVAPELTSLTICGPARRIPQKDHHTRLPVITDGVCVCACQLIYKNDSFKFV